LGISRITHRVINSAQLNMLSSSPVIEIGSHTVSHAKLSALSPEEQKNEIRKSKIELEKDIGKTVRLISYPFGNADDITPTTELIASEEGYEAGIANIQGNITRPVNLFSLPRRLARNWDKEQFSVWLKSGDKDRLEKVTLSQRLNRLIDVQADQVIKKAI